MRKLGTVTEAGEALGIDAADVWQEVAVGRLEAHRDDPDRPTTWIVYAPDEDDR